jgi:hypothetical protein
MGGKKATIEECQQYAQRHEGVCLSERYINSETKLHWKCPCGNEWMGSYKHMKSQNSWCIKCQYTNLSKRNGDPNGLQKAHDLAKSKGGQCLSTEYKNNRTYLNWVCREGHRFSAPMSNVGRSTDPTWCAACEGKARHSIEYCKEIAIERGGECVSIVYENAQKPLNWKCSKGHPWTTNLTHIISSGTWCPSCKYKNEQKCREILEATLETKFPKRRPPFLDGMELDGYCEELQLAFEYDGEQHYQAIEHWGGEEALKKRQEDDKIKDDLCVANKVKLIRIPYSEEDKEAFIKKYLDSIMIHIILYQLLAS